jgi:hypothetical protein
MKMNRRIKGEYSGFGILLISDTQDYVYTYLLFSEDRPSVIEYQP